MKGGNVMYIPLGVKTDYSLLHSLIKVPELIKYLSEHNVTNAAILDDNLFGSMCFYDTCIKYGIKPIIGLDIKINDYRLYLYAKNYNGYQNLLKINSIIQQRDINYIDLKNYNKDIVVIVPFASRDIYEEVNNIYDIVYVGYGNDFEKNNASIISDKIVYINIVCAFYFSDVKYLTILREIDTLEKEDIDKYSDAYLERDLSDNDLTSVPSTLKYLTKLEHLYVEINYIYALKK